MPSPQAKQRELKKSLNTQFAAIFELCHMVSPHTLPLLVLLVLRLLVLLLLELELVLVLMLPLLLLLLLLTPHPLCAGAEQRHEALAAHGVPADALGVPELDPARLHLLRAARGGERCKLLLLPLLMLTLSTLQGPDLIETLCTRFYPKVHKNIRIPPSRVCGFLK